MTREEMAQGVEALELFAPRGIGKPIPCATIAAELRKTCATCRHFHVIPIRTAVINANPTPVPMCAKWNTANYGKPELGFCHRWEAKP